MGADPIEARAGSEDFASMCAADPDIVFKTKAQFVRKLGDLLSLTSAGIYHCELLSKNGEEYVVVFYFGGTQRVIIVSGEDYLDIIKDVSTYCRKEGSNGCKQD